MHLPSIIAFQAMLHGVDLPALVKFTLVIAVAAFAAIVPACVTAGDLARNGGADLALVGGTIYVGPAEVPIEDGVLLIRDGLISAVGGRTAIAFAPTVRSIDCTGLTITAGFWNSHGVTRSVSIRSSRSRIPSRSRRRRTSP